MDGGGIVSWRREAQWKIKLIKFTSRLSWGTDEFPMTHRFAQLAAGGKPWQGGGKKAVLSSGALKLGARLGQLPATK